MSHEVERSHTETRSRYAVAGAPVTVPVVRETHIVPTERSQQNERPLSIEVSGMPFLIEHDGGWITLTCEAWPSLVAGGQTMEEALTSLYEVIGAACRVYLGSEQAELSEESVRFRDFLRESLAV